MGGCAACRTSGEDRVASSGTRSPHRLASCTPPKAPSASGSTTRNTAANAGPGLGEACCGARAMFARYGKTSRMITLWIDTENGQWAPEVWRPKVLQFLRANGYPALKPPEQDR